ncbi:MAG: MBL fold metallo-hydrolase [Pseudomonadales bacterium]|nr:MBL fold metallo-hydrolase [Pseudomonadales bacterium]
MKKLTLLSIFAFLTFQAVAQEAYYLANEGVMVTDGETKILFDPLYPESYGQYLLVPDEVRNAIFAGEAPFDDIDAVFVSHFHGDHFSAEDSLALLQAQSNVALYAPQQAVLGMRTIATDEQESVFDRVHAVSLQYKDAPVTLRMDNLLVEAVRIPHSGWPTGRVDVENIVWRVTLNDNTTVVHMGDADPNDVHFALNPEYWGRVTPNAAFPPYWFFASDAGQGILENRVGARRNVGVHVPVQIPGSPMARPIELRSADLFTRPGETRSLE